jgi:transposase
LWYLPPYSPDFNPIEKCWSQVKQLLRAAKARSLEALEQAVADALAAVTAENTQACYTTTVDMDYRKCESGLAS